MSCKNIGITLNLPRGSKLAGTYPEIARLSGTTLGCKALSLLAGFTLIDGGKLRIEIDCQANVAWILTADEKARLPDNDNGGRTLWRNIKQRVPSARRIKLPREKDESGKIIKMDPFPAPASILKEVRLLMRDRHGWRRPKQET